MSRNSVNFSDLFNFTRSTTATNLGQTSGPFSSVPINQPRFNDSGVIVERAATNVLLNSETPSTQTVSVTNGFPYTLASYGTGNGYAFVSNGGSGTAPIGNPITFTAQAATVEISVSGTLDGFQLETGEKASSFIPTTGAAATRSAENLTRTLGSEFNNTEGTLFLEFTHTHQGIYGNNLILSNGQSRSFIRSTALSAYKAYNGTTSKDYPAVSPPGTKEKLAISIIGNQWILARNGSSATYTVTTGSMLDVTTLKFFESSNGIAAKFEYWPTAKTAAELEELTA